MKRFAILSMGAAFYAIAGAQGELDTVSRIIDEGKNRSQVMSILTELSTKHGPRLTSSTRLDRANRWAMDQFKKYGCVNVHLEQWGEFPVGFDRGTKSFGRMTAPESMDFEFTSPSWTEGTNGPRKALAIKKPATLAELNANLAAFRGKWVVYATGQPARVGGGGGRPPQGGAAGAPPPSPEQVSDAEAMEKALDAAGIAGRVWGSRNELVITSGNWRIDWNDLPKGARAMVRKSDLDKIVAQLDGGKAVQLEFNLDQKFVRGPRPQYNVVAEIVGTEKPDEVVIVSGHFDTWDGPGSLGVCDNGTGSSVAIEAARILNKVKAKPKRTIRFILWTGEEQGLFGSAGYVALHMNEMDKISAVLVDDGGTNYQGGYVGIESQKAIMEAAFGPSVAAFPEMPQTFRVAERMPRGGGSDHASFNAVGVPGFFTNETGRADYNFVHHTQHDHMKYAIPEYLVQSATNHAVVAYNLACAPGLLPRGEKPATMPDSSRIPGLAKLLNAPPK